MSAAASWTIRSQQAAHVSTYGRAQIILSLPRCLRHGWARGSTHSAALGKMAKLGAACLCGSQRSKATWHAQTAEDPKTQPVFRTAQAWLTAGNSFLPKFFEGGGSNKNRLRLSSWQQEVIADRESEGKRDNTKQRAPSQAFLRTAADPFLHAWAAAQAAPHLHS